MVLWYVRRASRVDMKKLEKQEAKLKVCLCNPRDPQTMKLIMFSGQDREAVEAQPVRGLQAARSAQETGASYCRIFAFQLPTCTCIANVRRDVHEDQPFGCRCSIEEQIEGCSPHEHRRQLWLEPYTVRVPLASTLTYVHSTAQ